jgi:hypothetical protein
VAERPPKLGRLVVRASTAEAPPAVQPQLSTAALVGWGIGVLLLAGGIVASWQTGWLPAQFQPCRIVLRGCELSTAEEVIGQLPARQGDSYARWWKAATALKPAGSRWLRGVRPALLPGRSLLLRVQERKPVLRVESAGAGYWLCDDGSLERAQLADHQLPLFQAIKRQPVVRLDGMSLTEAEAAAPVLLAASAQCAYSLPGQIRTLAVSPGPQLALIDHTGLEIRLGGTSDTAVKIAALPKALRSASRDRSHLAYLDGTGQVKGGKFIFYEVHRASPSATSP